METNEEIIKSMIKKANSDNVLEVEEGLNYICKKLKSKELEKICLSKSIDFNLYKIYTKKANYSVQKIALLLPDLLNKISVLKDENIFKCFNGCGGCLMTVIFLIVGNIPSLETKFYNFVINYLGDYDGMILEKNSFKKMADKIVEDLKNSNEEICTRFNNSIWKDYLQATGILFSSNDFVEKSKEDSSKVNTFVEEYIKNHDGFNKENAEEIVKLLKEQ
jgi:hypothetical protein